MPKQNITDIQAAADILSTAATLGMIIPAPTNTTIYYYQTAKHTRPEYNLNNSGIHATREGALKSLATAVITAYEKHEKAPWLAKDFWQYVTQEEWITDMDGWMTKFKNHQENLRQEFIKTHTSKQIIKHFLGPEGKRWKITTAQVSL